MDPQTPLHDGRLRALLAALDRREQELREQIARRRGTLDDEGLSAEPTGDDADRAFTRDRATVENDLIELHLRELAQIEAARRRAAEGTYGLCADCGEPILLGRLEVYPTARRCAACQARHEKLSAAT
jgi:RNA polymerase-binding transcription factor DksA